MEGEALDGDQDWQPGGAYTNGPGHQQANSQPKPEDGQFTQSEGKHFPLPSALVSSP